MVSPIADVLSQLLATHPMNLHHAHDLALELMRAHGLTGWSFAFDRAKRRFGACHSRKRTITLSKYLTLLNPPEQVRETLLHEIAHALTPGDGHGPRWRAMCLRVGARPVRCYRETEVVAPPRRPAAYQMGCPRCGWWVDRRRLPTARARLVCRACRTPVALRRAAV